MNDNSEPMHFVCTREEAKTIIENQSSFWIANCGCREGNPNKCHQSRHDVCLWFESANESGFTGVKEVSKEEAFDLLKVAESCHLVTRPFRSESGKEGIGGICFCCQDCCCYFKNKEEICDKGKLIQQTDLTSCTGCGECTDVCFFGAREIVDNELKVHENNCYGCGLCADICPDIITMIPVKK